VVQCIVKTLLCILIEERLIGLLIHFRATLATGMAHSKDENQLEDSLPTLVNNLNSTYYYNKQLLRTGAFADCTVTCKTRSWPAHRNILSPRCDFFKCCFDGRFAEGRSRVISMEDDDPVAVEGMLYYLYTLDYPKEIYERLLGVEAGSGSDSGIEDEESTSLDAQVYWGFDLLMYTIADKYRLTELRKLAAQSLLAKADLAGKEEQLMKTMDGFVTLVENFFALEDVSDELGELRRQVVKSTSETLTHHVRDQRILALISEVPEFAVELVESLRVQRDEGRVLQKEEDRKTEAVRVRLRHIPMNDESDDEG
jgi:BTB/POZ domain